MRSVASWSVTARLLLSLAGGFLAILIGVGLFLYLVLERSLYRDEAKTLTDQIDAVRAVLPVDPNLSDAASESVRSLSAMTSQSHYGLRVTDELGRVVFETPGLSARVPSEIFRLHQPMPESGVSVERERRDGNTYLIATGHLDLDRDGKTRRIAYVAYDGWSDEDALLRQY